MHFGGTFPGVKILTFFAREKALLIRVLPQKSIFQIFKNKPRVSIEKVVRGVKNQFFFEKSDNSENFRFFDV